jgi:hypothetical protein
VLARFFAIAEEEAWTRTAPYGAMVITAVRRTGCEVLP